MTNTWPPQARDAGWAFVVLGRLSSGRLRRIGESYGNVPSSDVRADGCPRPTAAMGELTPLFWALASSCSVTTRLHIELFSDSEYATGVVEGRKRAQHATGLVYQARDMLQQARQLHRVLIHHVRAHSGVAGNEVADVLANTGRIRGPAPVQRVSPQFLHDSLRGSKRSRRTIQLDSLLFWEAIEKLPDPLVRPSSSVDTASPPAASLVIATANVLTLYPQEEDQGETWAPSARRAALAKQIREVGVDIVCRKADSGKISLLSVRAAPCGFQPQHRAALAGRSYGSTPAAATIHGRSFLFLTHSGWWSRAWSVVTLSTFVFYMHPRRTLLNGLRNGGTRRDRFFARCSGRLAT